MTATELVHPSFTFGRRPERRRRGGTWLNNLERDAERAFQQLRAPSFEAFKKTLRRMTKDAGCFATLSASSLDLAARRLRYRLHADPGNKPLARQAFALTCLTIQRELGIKLYDEQLYGGWLILEGFVAEMQTGEGKTLTATLPACAAALAGTPVHVITANDYLVERDRKEMAPIYEALGLTVGAVLEPSTAEERKRAYACDVTYISNKQVAFDYLKDQQHCQATPWSLRARLHPLLQYSGAQSPFLQRGLCFGIIDEADSVLIDDAKTPLILSRPTLEPISSTVYSVAVGLARRLSPQEDFVVELNEKQVFVTETGKQRLIELTEALPDVWQNSRYREEYIHQALTALCLYQRDDDYLVHDGKILLIDKNTGRAMPDRSLSHGVHQMVEAKERCKFTPPNETLGRISYQRFFSRYFRLGGMTGTAVEVRKELQQVYGLAVKRVPAHCSDRRRTLPIVLCSSTQSKYDVLIPQVKALHESKRPVLIGTRSVAESEQISRILARAELPNQVLNATQDASEAEIIREAGQPGQIVVATNMAGRGTDIPLQPGVVLQGGLHVVGTALNDSSRIDRQLAGRCARQGDAGSHQFVLSLDDELIGRFYPEPLRKLLKTWANPDSRLWRIASKVLVRVPQWARERQLRRVRRDVLRNDKRLDDMLAFAGSQR